ncbi:hypothetical protein D3C81_1439130 [compost metagenome]
MSNLVHMVFNFDQNAHILHIFYNLLAAFAAIKTLVFACGCIHRTALIHNRDLRQIMSKTNFEVVRIVRRCNFNSTTAEVLLYIFISDNRNLTTDNRQNYRFAY